MSLVKKSALILVLLLLVTPSVYATHLISMDIKVEKQSGADEGLQAYKVVLELYRDCMNSQIDLEEEVLIGIYKQSDSSLYTKVTAGLLRKNQMESYPCNFESVCVEKGYYEKVFELNADFQYFFVFERCCRPQTTNISMSSNGVPNQSSLATVFSSEIENDIPQIKLPITSLCVGQEQWIDLELYDKDGDSLAFEISPAYQSLNATLTNAAPDPASTFKGQSEVNYNNGYSWLTPFGSDGLLEVRDGGVSVMSRELGNYVLGIKVLEYRNGELISSKTVDFTVSVLPCPPYADYDLSLGYGPERSTALRWNVCNGQRDYDVIYRTLKGSGDTVNLDTSYDKTSGYWDSSDLQGNSIYSYRIKSFSKQRTLIGQSEWQDIGFGSLSDKMHDAKDIRIYPNPAHDHISIDGMDSPYTLILSDSRGVLVQSIDVKNTQVPISIAALRSGAYVLQLISKDAVVTKKLLVQD